MRDDMSTSNQREVGREYSNGEGLPENSHLDLSQWRWFPHCRQPLPNRVTPELPVIRPQSRIGLCRISGKPYVTLRDQAPSGRGLFAFLTGAPNYFSLAYSALASSNIGMSGSASFHNVRKCWYAARLL